MNGEVISAKLESLSRCLARIVQWTPQSAADLRADLDAQDIISVNLQRAVQLCVDAASVLISDRGWESAATMADSFTRLAENGVIAEQLAESLRRSVGFRNVAVHEYQDVDWDRVYVIITQRLSDFRALAAALMRATGPPGLR